MNLDFFLAILNAMNMGDLLNEVGYQIRPYEVEPGRDRRACSSECMEDLPRRLAQQRKPYRLEGTVGRASSSALPEVGGMSRARRPSSSTSSAATSTSTRCRARAATASAEVEVDRTRVKPLVKITGEFWAQTTEGDGNFNMFPFLEREDAQVLVEPIGTWICYMIHQAKQTRSATARGVTEDEAMPSAWRRRQARWPRELAARKKIRRARPWPSASSSASTNRLREALGGIAARAGRPARAAADRRTRSTTRAPAAARATSRWPRTSTTATRTSATWCSR